MSPFQARVTRLAAAHLMRVGIDFRTPEAMKTYLKEHPGADKSKHKVTKSKKNERHAPASFSKKHGVHLRGISEANLDEFLNDPEGKELSGYKLEVIAGDDGVVDAESLKRAVGVRKSLVALQRAKDKPKEQRTKADDDALDVCQQNPPVCADNIGVSRDSMPQFTQEPLKDALAGISDEQYGELLRKEKAGEGIHNEVRDRFHARKHAEAAVAEGADPNSEKSTFDSFVDRVKKKGVKVTTVKGGMRVGDLKATQREISADAVLRNADKHLQGKPLGGGVIYVSSDNHILDGHHRWAGLLTADPDARIPVVKLGMPMKKLLEASFEEPGVFRQDFRFRTAPADNPIDLAREAGEVWKQRNGKWYGKNKEKAGGPFASREAAQDYASGTKGKTAELRAQLIRLASVKPELRGHLLLLLTMG